MRRLGKFLALSVADQRLLLAALGWTAAARVALWILPFAAVRRLLARAAQPVVGAKPFSLDKLIASIEVAARAIPRATCLTKAIASQILLARHGFHADLRIGVRRSPSGQFQAHAWLEHNGITIGAIDSVQPYAPLPPF